MSPLKRSNNIAARMGRWSANHWKTAVFGWLAFVVASVVIGGQVGTKYLEDNDLAVGEAATATKMIEAGFPNASDEQGEIVLIQSKTLKADDPAFKAVIEDVAKTVGGFHEARKIDTPYDVGHGDLVSDDRHSAMVQYEPVGTYDEAALYIDKLTAAVDKTAAQHPGFEVNQLGSVSTTKATDAAFAGMLKTAGMIAIPLTLLILLFVFGSAVAAFVPLLLAITAVVATTSLIAIPSQFIAVDEQIGEVILLIGLAVGIDYSLFYLRREREERAAGRSEHAALEAAAATSGRAVLISGITVLIAMAGMFLSGDKTFMSFSIGTMMVVAVAMIGSLTVLPAVLGRLGDKVEKGRIPFLGRLRSKNGESRFWGAILDRVLRRPVLSAVASGAVLVALAIPAFSLNTATTGVDDISIPEIQPLKKFDAAFPGGNDPAVIAIKADDVRTPAIQDAIVELKQEALASGQMKGPIELEVNRDSTVAQLSIPLAGTSTDAKSQAALATLREDLLPSTLGQVEGVDYAVTGTTALDKDWEAKMATTAPLVFGFVLLFAFLIMLVSFRSIVVALKAILLNLLSVGAAYGILVAIFQHGWLAGALGFQTNGAIVSWLPLFLFVVLFGLSMDYHVFILTRIREAYDRGMSTEEAVSHGLKTTAGVVTSAAAVMVAVFAIFATLSFLDFKQMGVGLAAAILIDATVIRGVLLPAAMKLLGERNWYLPRWLEWLPRVGAEERPARRRRAPREGAVGEAGA